MENERKKVPFFTAFLREFAKIFTLMILSMSLAGKIFFNYNPEIQYFSSIFSLGGTGLPYTIILQSVGFAIIMAAASRFLFSEYIEMKISFIWRSILFLLTTLLTSSIFALFFKWIPVDNIQAWLISLLFFIIFYFVAIGFSLLLLKLEDKKYNKLLENYKNKL